MNEQETYIKLKYTEEKLAKGRLELADYIRTQIERNKDLVIRANFEAVVYTLLQQLPEDHLATYLLTGERRFEVENIMYELQEEYVVNHNLKYHYHGVDIDSIDDGVFHEKGQ